MIAVNPYAPRHIRPLARNFPNTVAECVEAGMNRMTAFSILNATRRNFPHLAWDDATRVVIVSGHDRETVTVPWSPR